MFDIQVANLTEYLALVDSKGLLGQYIDAGNRYELYAGEASTFVWRYTVIKESAEATTFETSYKATWNQPLFIGEDNVINALAVRDTNDHFSLASDNRGAVPKTIIIYNHLDQTVNFQLQGDRASDFLNAVNIGNTFNVIASSDGYATVSDYFPYLRLKYSSSVTPTTGALTVYMEKVRE